MTAALSVVALGLGVGATPAFAAGNAGAHSPGVHSAMVRAAMVTGAPGGGRPAHGHDSVRPAGHPLMAAASAGPGRTHVPPGRVKRATIVPVAPAPAPAAAPARAARRSEPASHGRSRKPAPAVKPAAPAKAKGRGAVPGQAQKSARQGAQVAGSPVTGPVTLLYTPGSAQPLQVDLASVSIPALPSAPERIPSAVPVAAAARPSSGSAAPARAHRRRGLEALLGVGGLSLQSENRLRVPIFFFLFLALFVAIQALIDRRDPKVMEAPERSMDDSVGFE